MRDAAARGIIAETSVRLSTGLKIVLNFNRFGVPSSIKMVEPLSICLRRHDHAVMYSMGLALLAGKKSWTHTHTHPQCIFRRSSRLKIIALQNRWFFQCEFELEIKNENYPFKRSALLSLFPFPIIFQFIPNFTHPLFYILISFLINIINIIKEIILEILILLILNIIFLTPLKCFSNCGSIIITPHR